MRIPSPHASHQSPYDPASPVYFWRKDPVLLLVLVLLAVFHLCALTVPPGEADEAALIDWTIHRGRFSWEVVLGPAFEHMAYMYGAHGLWNGFLILIRQEVALFGASLAAVRAPIVLVGLFDLTLLTVLLHELAIPRFAARLSLTLFGLSFLFLYISHEVRPESLILLIGLAHMLWVWRRGSRWTGVILGFTAGFAIAIHQAIIFPILSLPFLEWTRPQPGRTRCMRYVWWLAGSLAGGLLAVRIIDWEAGARAVQIVIGKQIILPPLIGMHANPWSLMLFGFRLLNLPYMMCSSTHGLLIGIMVASLTSMLSRWRDLVPCDKFISMAALSEVLLITLTTGAADGRYVIYCYPWLLSVLLVTSVHFWDGRFRPRLLDVLALALSIAVSFAVRPRHYHALQMLALTAICVRFLTASAYTRLTGLVFVFSFLILLGASCFNSFVYLAITCGRSFHFYPISSILIVSVPLLFLTINQESLHWRFKTLEARAPFLALFLMTVLAIHTFADTKLLAQTIKASRIGTGLAELMEPTTAATRIFAPAALPLYFPTCAIYSLDALNLMPPVARKSAFLRLRPDYLVASPDMVSELCITLKGNARLSALMEKSTPLGRLQGVKILWESGAHKGNPVKS